MDHIKEVFRTNITRMQATRFSTAKKIDLTFSKRALFILVGNQWSIRWKRQYAAGIFIQYVKTNFEKALTARVNTIRESSKRQADLLCPFAQLMDSDTISDGPREPK